MAHGRRRVAEGWAPALVYLALGLLLSPGWLHASLLWDERTWEYIAWRLEAGRLFAAGEFPFFTDRVFCGMPLFSAAYMGVLYPATWLTAWLGPLAAAWLTGVHSAWGALGIYCYARAIGAGRGGAFAGGLLFLCGGYYPNVYGVVTMHEASAWAPWVALAVRGYLRKPGAGGWLAITALLAVQLATGYAQVAFITSFWIAFEGAVFLLGAGRRRAGGWVRATARVLGVGAALALAGALLAVQIIPAMDHSKETFRTDMTLELWQINSTDPADTVMHVSPRALGAPAFGWRGENEGGGWVFLSSAAYVLALVPLLAWVVDGRLRRGAGRRRRHTAAALWFGAILIWILAAGRYVPLNQFLFHVPGFSMFRVPSRWLLLECAWIAAAAALGADWVLRRARGWRAPATLLGVLWVGWAAACAGTTLALRRAGPFALAADFETVSGLFFGVESGRLPGVAGASSAFELWLRGPGMLAAVLERKEVHWIGAVLALAALVAGRKFPRAAMSFGAGVLALEGYALIISSAVSPLRAAERARIVDARRAAPLAAALAQEAPERVFALGVTAGHEWIPYMPNGHLFAGLGSAAGYCPLYSRWVGWRLNLGQTGRGWFDDKYYGNPAPLQHFAVSHVILRPADMTAHQRADFDAAVRAGTYEVVAEDQGLLLARLPKTAPRVHLARAWQRLDPYALYDTYRLVDPPVAEREVILNAPAMTALDSQFTTATLVAMRKPFEPGRVKVLTMRGSQQRFRVETTEPGLLVIHDCWWPGWQWRVESTGWRAKDAPKPEPGPWRPVLNANEGARVVPVPAGNHVIELRYRPPRWTLACRISLVALGIYWAVGTGAVVGRRRRKDCKDCNDGGSAVPTV